MNNNINSTSKFFKATMATVVAASTVAVMAPELTNASKNSFKDINSSEYYYNDVLNLSSRGIINGFPDGAYKPNDYITRGQAAKIIAGILNLDTENVTNPNFSDIPKSHPYYGAISALKQAGIIDGYEDGSFHQELPIQRNHVAKILTNAFNLKANNVNNIPFTDVIQVYKEAIAALYENNITTGKTATEFAGTSNVTRGQMASFIVRAETAGNAQTEQASEKTVTFKVTDYTNSTIVINDKTYTFDKVLKSVFTESNKAALKGASIVANVDGNMVKSVNSLTLNSEGTADDPVKFETTATIDSLVINANFLEVKNVNVLNNATITSKVDSEILLDGVKIEGDLIVDDSIVGAVASLDNKFAQDNQKGPKLKLVNAILQSLNVKRDNASISSNTRIPEITISANVEVVNVDGTVSKMKVESTSKLEITGKTNVEQLVLDTVAELVLNISGVIESFVVEEPKATVSVGTDVKVNKLKVPEGTSASTIIDNYSFVSTQIENALVSGNAVNTNEQSSNSSSSSSGGGSSVKPTVIDVVSIDEKPSYKPEDIITLPKTMNVAVKYSNNTTKEVSNVEVDWHGNELLEVSESAAGGEILGTAIIEGKEMVVYFKYIVIPGLTEYNKALASVTEEDYTEASWAEYQKVVKANYVDVNYSQKLVNEATTAIKAAQEEKLVSDPNRASQVGEESKVIPTVINAVLMDEKHSYMPGDIITLPKTMDFAVKYSDNTKKIVPNVEVDWHGNESFEASESNIGGERYGTTIIDGKEMIVTFKYKVIPDLTEYNKVLTAVSDWGYTSESWAEYQKIVKENYVDSYYSQKVVNAATAAIKAAQDKLEYYSSQSPQEDTDEGSNGIPTIIKANTIGKIASFKTGDTITLPKTMNFAVKYSNNTKQVVSNVEVDWHGNESFEAIESAAGGEIFGTAIIEGEELGVYFKYTIIPDLTEYNQALTAVTEEEYTEASWAEYQKIVEENNAGSNYSQILVDDATKSIKSAQSKLVSDPDRKPQVVEESNVLPTVITAVSMDEITSYKPGDIITLPKTMDLAVKYSNNTKEIVKNVNVEWFIGKTFEVSEDAISGEILGAAIIDGEEMIVSFKYKVISDLTEYNKVLEAVTKGDYTAESWTEYQKIVEENYVDLTYSQKLVNDATAAIKDAQQEKLTYDPSRASQVDNLNLEKIDFSKWTYQNEKVELVFSNNAAIFSSDANLVVKLDTKELGTIGLPSGAILKDSIVISLKNNTTLTSEFYKLTESQLQNISVELSGGTYKNKDGLTKEVEISGYKKSGTDKIVASKFKGKFASILEGFNDITLADQSQIDDALNEFDALSDNVKTLLQKEKLVLDNLKNGLNQ